MCTPSPYQAPATAYRFSKSWMASRCQCEPYNQHGTTPWRCSCWNEERKASSIRSYRRARSTAITALNIALFMCADTYAPRARISPRADARFECLAHGSINGDVALVALPRYLSSMAGAEGVQQWTVAWIRDICVRRGGADANHRGSIAAALGLHERRARGRASAAKLHVGVQPM